MTNQPLTIDVHESMFSHPEILKLMAAGHTVRKLVTDADLIWAPQAHYGTTEMLDYLPAALTAARTRRRKK